MRILFISSGNTKDGISPIIKNQGESLKKQNIELDYYTITGRGVQGYLKAIPKIRKHLKSNDYNIIHAHYWLSAITASLAGARPMVASLMGDDVKTKAWFRWIIYIFHHLFWAKTIVKSKDMYDSFREKNIAIIPNGIDMNRFKPIDREIAIKETGWDRTKKHILFTSNPKRIEKNFKLAQDAFNLIKDENLELHYLVDIPNEKIPYYYNSASVVILTSLWEGSPNAIKEAMACNIPIVSTNVGDVEAVISKTEGCYISSFNHKEFASNIQKALNFGKRTTGREDIAHLKSELIAKKIIEIYNNIKGK